MVSIPLRNMGMARLQRVAKSLVPARLQDALRAMHRDIVFRRAMRRFRANPEACTHPGSPIVRDLIYGWGNESWSALQEYLTECIRHALNARGPILECGSGLTTVLMGTIAQRQGQSLWSLEHLPGWAARVQRCLDRYSLDTVVLHVAPLRDFGTFDWYDAPLGAMPDSFSLVICDGPPGGTKGGRYGLVPVMTGRLEPLCVILLDDAGREQELAIARRWEIELGASFETLGRGKPYIRMTVLGRPLQAAAGGR
jgi:hypothetical protein